MKKSEQEHWGICRWKSEIVYAICKGLHLRGDFKINIIHFVRRDEFRKRGHAWVTRDDKDLRITPAYRPSMMRIVGENEKYRYWISDEIKEGIVESGKLKDKSGKFKVES